MEKGLALGFISRGAQACVPRESFTHLKLLELLSCKIRALPGLENFTYSSLQINVNVESLFTQTWM